MSAELVSDDLTPARPPRSGPDTPGPVGVVSAHSRAGDGPAEETVADGDAVAVIELELLKLVRHLETLGRRSSLYARLDRAGYLALRTLDVLGPVNANALAQALGLDASTLTRQITDLERQGFVERRANPADRRSAIIFITPAGRRAMYDVQAERRVHIEALTSDFDAGARAALGDTLTRLNAALADSVSRHCAAAHRETAAVTAPPAR
jgi:DNA-binding MarR family transcriptional regulator